MGEKTMKSVISQVILFATVPSLLFYLSRSDLLQNLQNAHYFSETINIDLTKDFAYVLGMLLGGGYLSIRLGVTELKLARVVKQRNAMTKVSKDFFLKVIKAEFSQYNFSRLQLDAYVPYDSLWTRIKHYLEHLTRGVICFEKYFVPIDGISTNLDARFKVFPECQSEGLVGQCFVKRSVVLKCEDDQLRMTSSQINMSQEWVFWMCAPDFDTKTNEVTMILSLTSDQKVTMEDVDMQEISKKLISYAAELNKELLKNPNESKNARSL
jgi:hypothetical protein